MRALCLASLVASAAAHGALYHPRPRNSQDGYLPEFQNGKSPVEACTCNNGNGGPNGPTEGCDMGLRGDGSGAGDGQACLWWSQVRLGATVVFAPAPLAAVHPRLQCEDDYSSTYARTNAVVP
jgi:hypothetical protein